MPATALRFPAAPRASFTDRRSADRRFQLTWHPEARTVVLSVWHANLCAATFQLAAADVPAMIANLATYMSEVVTEPAVTRPRETKRARLIARLRAAVRRERTTHTERS